MRSISHWGMFESYDKEVRNNWQPADNRTLGKYMNGQNPYYVGQSIQNAQNAIYQAYNFGKLD